MRNQEEYRTARLSQQALDRVQSLESRLQEEGEKEIILIAYEKDKQ
ncbi:hypothetical protein [Bacillus massilinigeriensis]|nr:hypothetical protein [Bacillus mediterraneensis]